MTCETFSINGTGVATKSPTLQLTANRALNVQFNLDDAKLASRLNWCRGQPRQLRRDISIRLIELHFPLAERGTPPMATATKKQSKIRLQPMGERIVIKRVESEETTAGGIVLPDSAREKPARGTVVAVGSGRLLDDGSRAESQLSNGDIVLFSSYAGEPVEIDDVEYLLMREDDVLAVIG